MRPRQSLGLLRFARNDKSGENLMIQGITFSEDCLIGATNSLERWVCENSNIPILVGLAYKGILLKAFLLFIVAIILLIIFMNRKKLRKGVFKR